MLTTAYLPYPSFWHKTHTLIFTLLRASRTSAWTHKKDLHIHSIFTAFYSIFTAFYSIFTAFYSIFTAYLQHFHRIFTALIPIYPPSLSPPCSVYSNPPTLSHSPPPPQTSHATHPSLSYCPHESISSIASPYTPLSNHSHHVYSPPHLHSPALPPLPPLSLLLDSPNCIISVVLY